MKTKTPLIVILTCFICLTGCQSEVDKCTNALVKANEPYKNSAEKADAEARARFGCLGASRGN